MGKKGKKSRAGKLTRKDISKQLDSLVENLEEELNNADIFAPFPSMEDCPLCFLPLSRVPAMSKYQACCGKRLCKGCSREQHEILLKAYLEKNAGKKIDPHADLPKTCPFCRKPPVSSAGGHIRRLEERMLQNDAMAIVHMGTAALNGVLGMSKNELKAIDCFIRAAELGSADACCALADRFEAGTTLSDDGESSAFFLKVGAIRGNISSRSLFGLHEYGIGNHEEGIRHWKIAAEAGFQPALDRLKEIFLANGRMPGKVFITKEYLDKTFRICHEAQKEVESEERKKHCDVEKYDDYRC